MLETALDRSLQNSERRFFFEGRYELSADATDYVVSEAMFLPVLRILIPDRAEWNGGVLQEHLYSVVKQVKG